MQVFVRSLWWLWEDKADPGRGNCTQMFTGALWWLWEEQGDLGRSDYTGPGSSAPHRLHILTLEQDLSLTCKKALLKDFSQNKGIHLQSHTGEDE